MGTIVANVLVGQVLSVDVGRIETVSADIGAYEEMEKDARNKDRFNGSKGDRSPSRKKGARPNPNGFIRFFMVSGAFGLILWAGSRIVTYYELWLPVLEDHDSYFQYTQAVERYANVLFAADAIGLFLVIISIIGVLTLVLNELSHAQ